MVKYFWAWISLTILLLGMLTFGCDPLLVRSPPDEGSISLSDPRENPDAALPPPRLHNDSLVESPSWEPVQEWEEGSVEGLSLDIAIDRLLTTSLELAARFQDIPKARADVLTAGLRSDPIVFLSAVPIPYGRFSPQQPGATAYNITFVQPLDLSGKHRTNKRVAEKNIPILEAHYQDAVRLEIDRLFTVFVNVLQARAEVGAARAHLKILTEAAQRCEEQLRQGLCSPSDSKRVSIRQARARIALRQAE